MTSIKAQVLNIKPDEVVLREIVGSSPNFNRTIKFTGHFNEVTKEICVQVESRFEMRVNDDWEYVGYVLPETAVKIYCRGE